MKTSPKLFFTARKGKTVGAGCRPLSFRFHWAILRVYIGTVSPHDVDIVELQIGQVDKLRILE